MIIFGTRGVTYNADRGDFFCPTCHDERGFQHKRVRRFFTLYFIPVIPLDMLGEYVECERCLGTYKPEVLEFDPREADRQFEAEFQKAIKRVMVMMMLADGVIDDDEITTIREVYRKIGKAELSDEDVQTEAALAEKDGRPLKDYVGGLGGTLNDAGKELVLHAAWFVANADGDFAEEEKNMLLDLGEALEMSHAHVLGVIASLGEAAA